MPQDAFTLRHLCRELNSIFSGGKINKIVQPTPEQIIFTVYDGKTTKKLYVSVVASDPRIGVTDDDKNTDAQLNFSLLLKKYILSGTINKISLCGFDRIVRIDVTPSKQFFDSEDKVIYVELMGRYSNVILTENGKVLGANRGVNMFDGGIRPLFTGHDYVFPPTNGKLEPCDKTLINVFKDVEGDVYEYVCTHVSGLAKSTAKWIVDGFINKFDIKDVSSYIKDNPEIFFDHLNLVIYSNEVNPCVSMENGVVKELFSTPYDTGEYKYFDSIVKAEDYYFRNKFLVKSFNQKLSRLTALSDGAIKKAEKRVKSICQKIESANNFEDNRIKGELIISNIYRIKQGDKVAKVENYYDDGKVVEIPLDENLSPSKNADNYYKKYNKQKRTISALEPQLAKAKEELSYAQSIKEQILISETEEELDAILKELKQDRKIDKKKQKEKEGCHKYIYEGYVVKAGRSNLENDALLINADKDSIWLHVKDYHSSHVIIENKGGEIPMEVIIFGAEVCAYYSKCKDTDKAEVVYTKKRHVKKPKGAKPGFVTYDNFKSVLVCPKKHEEMIKRV